MVPKPSPMLPTMSPSAAGKRIRIIAKAMYDSIKTSSDTSFVWTPTPPSMDSMLTTRRADVSEAERDLLKAIKTRKVSEIELRLSYLRGRQREQERYMERVITKSFNTITSLKGTYGSPHGVVVFDATGERKTWKDAIQELSLVAQSLPSWDDLPSANQKDTIIRGIIAILRLHKVPGSEDLSQSHPVEGGTNATASAGHASVGGTGIVIGGDVFNEDEDEEDEEGDEYGDEYDGDESVHTDTSIDLGSVKPF